MEKRDCEKYVVKKAMTERYRKSAIVSMQRLLNQSEREKREPGAPPFCKMCLNLE